MERKTKLLIGATVLGSIGALVAFWPDEAHAASAPGPKPVPKPKPVVAKAETPEQKAAKAAALEAARSADWQKAVVEAVRSGDAAALEHVAQQMQAAGKAQEAASLRALVASWMVDATRLTEAQDATHAVLTTPKAADPVRQTSVGLPTASAPRPAVGVPVLPSLPVGLPSAATKPPAIVTAPVADAVKVARTKRTADLMVHLRSVARYKEDKTQVKLWQQAEGRTMDGKYGPGDATHVITTYDLIPACPFYWSSKGGKVAEKQKQDFTALLNAKAKAQPERASLWLALIPLVRKS